MSRSKHPKYPQTAPKWFKKKRRRQERRNEHLLLKKGKEPEPTRKKSDNYDWW